MTARAPVHGKEPDLPALAQRNIAKFGMPSTTWSIMIERRAILKPSAVIRLFVAATLEFSVVGV